MPAAAPFLGQIALNLALGVAGTVVASLLAPAQVSQPSAARASGISFETQIGEALPIPAVWGLSRAAHQFTYKNEYGTNNEFVQLVYRVGMGEHDGLEKFLVDEKPVTLTGSNSDAKGYAVSEYTVEGTPYLWVKYYAGAPGQAADAELVARANPPERWTAAHKLTGWAYLIVTMRYNEDLFGNTIPQWGSVWRGLKICDFTNPACIWGDPSTYVFTKNPAKLAWYWRRGHYVNGVRVQGMGYSSFANDTAYFTAAANRCDESFTDPETETTFPIFEFGRQIFDDEDKLSVLRQFEAAWSGSSFRRGGAYAPLVAQALTPVMTLTENDRLRRIDGAFYPVQADWKGSVSIKKTIWHGQFVSEENGWALSGFEPRINTSFQSVLGGDRAQALDQPFESNQVRAQMRAEIALRRQLYPATRTETYGPKARVLELGDLVTVQCEWGSVPMIVEGVKPVDGLVGVTLTLRQWNNAIVPVSGESFVTIPSALGTTSAEVTRQIVISGLNVTAYQTLGGNAELPCCKATWTQTTDPNVEQVMIRVWPVGGSEAVDGQDFFASARLTNRLVSRPLAPETEYTGYAIPIRSDGRTCVPTNPFTFTTGEMVAPAIADGVIDTDALNAELKNITGTWIDTLFDRTDALEAALGNLAQTVASGETNHQREISGLLTKSENALASVRRLEETIVGPDGALAQLQDEVTAIFNDMLAGGAIRFRAEAGVGGATSQIVIEAYVESEDAWAAAGTMYQVLPDGSSRTVNYADQMVWTDGSEFAVPAVFEGSVLYLSELKVKLISSPDGQSFWRIGTDGAMRTST